jgi:hypothetical protein
LKTSRIRGGEGERGRGGEGRMEERQDGGKAGQTEGRRKVRETLHT